jgi:hypothetical protein
MSVTSQCLAPWTHIYYGPFWGPKIHTRHHPLFLTFSNWAIRSIHTHLFLTFDLSSWTSQPLQKALHFCKTLGIADPATLASHPMRLESATLPMWKPQISLGIGPSDHTALTQNIVSISCHVSRELLACSSWVGFN